jgi:DNA polymerase
MSGVTSEYSRVLEATEQHLRALKNGGTRFLTVEASTLQQLREAPPLAEKTPPVKMEVPIAEPVAPVAAPVAVPVVLPTVPPSESPIVANQDRATAMAALRAKVDACLKCPHLVSSRKNVVFGVGDIHAALMFVGEAPGADEDEKGEPFVGMAGQLLTRIIKAMGLGRDTVYIANILKCRPDTPGRTSGNRKPTAEEMSACSPYLLEQIGLIRPKVIVALGATAMEGLLGKTEGIGKLRGHFLMFRDTPLMPTFHPAYLLRNQAPGEKRKVWEDMLAVMEKLEMPISPKQRGYFLKA